MLEGMLLAAEAEAGCGGEVCSERSRTRGSREVGA